MDGADPGDLYRAMPAGDSTLCATGLPAEPVLCDGGLRLVRVDSRLRITATGPR